MKHRKIILIMDVEEDLSDGAAAHLADEMIDTVHMVNGIAFGRGCLITEDQMPATLTIDKPHPELEPQEAQ